MRRGSLLVGPGEQVRSSSYQSPIASWKPLLLLASLGLAGAKPYEDTRQRFSIELPEAWRLAPRFGDLYGMSFERTIEAGQRAMLTVHADPASATSLRAFADEVEAEWSRDKKTERLKETRREIAGQPAIVRELVVKSTKARVRSHVLRASGRWYHVRLEAPPAGMRVLEAELAAILDSFQPMRPREREPELAAPAEEDTEVAGTWIGAGDVELVLEPGGGFTLGSRSGRYTVSGRTLELSVAGKPAQRFEVERMGDELRLSSPSLRAPAIYRRAAAEGTANAGSDGPEGRWSTPTPSGPVELLLSPDGTFVMGPVQGRWTGGGGRLTLRGAQGESVTYRYSISGSTFVLSGGDLDAPLEFRRIPGG